MTGRRRLFSTLVTLLLLAPSAAFASATVVVQVRTDMRPGGGVHGDPHAAVDGVRPVH